MNREQNHHRVAEQILIVLFQLVFSLALLAIASTGCSKGPEQATPTPPSSSPTEEPRATPTLPGSSPAEKPQATPASEDSLPVEKPQASTSITFAPADASKLEIYQLLAEQFNELYPGVRVDVQPPDYSAGSSLAARAGQADCFVYYSDLDSEENRAAVLNLEPFLGADGTLQLTDFLFADSFRRAGLLWALPAEGFPKVMVYNKALLDAAGVAYPTLDWTLDDFMDTAVTLAQGEGETYGFVSGSLETTDLMFFLEQRGAPLIVERNGLFEFLFNAPAMQEAVQWYADLSQAYGAKPVFKADWQARSAEVHNERQTLILQGRAAMWTSYFGSELDALGDEIEVGIAPLPGGPGRVGDYMADGYYISATSTHPQECWKWIKFLSGRMEMASGVPAHRLLAESNTYRQQVGEEEAAVLLAALNNTERLISFRQYGTSGRFAAPFRWLAQAYDAVAAGELDVDAALAEAQHKADTYQGCLAEKGGLTHESVWAECAREEDGDAQAEARPTAPAQHTPPPDELPQPETMLVFTPADPSELAVYQRLAQQFQKDHPDLGVDVRQPDYSHGGGLTTLAGQADCFATYPSLDSEENRAAVLSLDPFVDVDPEFDLSDLDFVDSFRYEGQLWGAPLEIFPKVIVYNKSLFDASGASYPALDWTLDDFMDAAIALTGNGNVQYGFISGMLETTDLMFFLEQQGALLIDESNDPVAFLFDASDTQAAMQWYVDLYRVHQVKPTFKADWRARAADAFDQQIALILNGQAAMWTSYPGPGVNYPLGDEIEASIAPLPQGPGRVGDYQVRGYYIAAQTEYPQGCWEWIKFLTGQTEQLNGLPARRSLAAAESYQLKVGEEKLAALQQAFANADRTTAFMDDDRPGWTGTPLLWLAQAFDAAVQGELSVAAALAEAQHKADAYRDCLTAQDGLEDSAAWEACAAEVEATWGP